ncbi:MAG: N-acetyl-gamma-glutamyl-phosphate reductase [Spirochaeta sp.]|nr:N-acetyl-gamma-glutamyl-phosphate reductase [Spirochaeta sp.]
MKAVVLGSTGYTGLVLLRILLEHPDVSSILPVSSSKAGGKVTDIDAGLNSGQLNKFAESAEKLITIDEAVAAGPDVVFAALPHLESARICSPFLGSTVVIDLSADFRIKNRESFQRAYGAPPPRPDFLAGAVYGLAEWYREEISKADLMRNPGCYPTAVLLPLLPLLKEGVIGRDIITSAISGISGAGRKAKVDYLFCERSENAGAYAPGKSHRHVAEMEAELQNIDPDSSLIFTPHLAPLKRGMTATTVTELLNVESNILDIYEKYYSDSPFIRLITGRIPATGDVWGTNRCDIAFQVEGNKLLLFSVIDNLVKGAAGQAVQNMNIRFGLAEQSGLKSVNEI